MRRTPARVPTFVATPPAGGGHTPPAAAGTLDDWPTNGIRGSHRSQATTSRGLHGLMWTLLTGAVLLGLLDLTNLGGHRTPAAATPVITTGSPVAPPGGCAELLVTAWLSGDTTVLAALVSAEVPRLPAGQRTATRTYTLSADNDPATPATWSYVIGADVVTVDKQGRTSAAGVQFFAVTLTQQPAPAAGADTCAGWAAPTLPAQVAGLSKAERQELAYDRSIAVTSQPIAETLTPFFTALLAGGTNVERYLAPGVSIAAITPPPYTSVRLERLVAVKGTELGTSQTLPADGAQAQLLATVAAKVGNQPGEWRLTYPLQMAVRGGRWEITALDASPAYPAAAPSPAPARPGINRPSARAGIPSDPIPASSTPGITR